MEKRDLFPFSFSLLKKTSFYFLFVIALFLSNLVFGQKPKLGLVLSGGGAKGIAHIGVLKAMEESGIKPDYITGTSMGSIIGGLYAMGYNANQIEKVVENIDWDLILSNNIPMNYISYEEKEYYNRFLIELAVENGKIAIPSGLIEGQMLSEALNHYTWPAMSYDHFDDFPIPFRCIATDVSTGRAIVFEDGSLAEAMRASMAIPTAFTAANLDSTLAVDGGVVNNFPSDVLKEMGAEIIIGVNVTKGFKHSDEVNTMTGILLQMSMLSSNEKLPERAALCNLYLQPDLSDYSTASFNKYEEILEIGEKIGQAFRPKFDSIAQIIGKEDAFPGIDHAHEELIINKIELSGNKLFGDDLIEGKLGIETGDTVNPAEVEEGVRTVFGINGFNKVEYRLKKSDNKKDMDLKLKMSEKPPTSLRASFHYDNTFSAGIVLNVQFRDILLKSSRAIITGDISENPKFRFDYYKYTGQRKKVALNFRYDYLKEQLPIYAKGEKVDIESNIENSFQINLLTTQSLKSSFLIGYNYETNRFKSEFSSLFPQGVDYGDLSFSRMRFGYTRNSLNNQNYPTDGAERFIRFDGYFSNQYKVKFKNPDDSLFFVFSKDSLAPLYFTENEANEYLSSVAPKLYGSLYFRSIDYLDISNHFQIIPYVTLGLIASFDSINSIFNEFIVGGHQQVKNTDTKFLGLNYGEKSLENFVIGGLFFQNVIKKNWFVQYGANVLSYHNHLPLNDLENIDLKNTWENQTIVGYGGEVTFKSYVGPVTLGVSSNSEDGYLRYYFAIGFSLNYSD